jgi:carbonic anhydrase/acetyltransferase-like protein (isoleucine patch superfamily)
VSAASTCRDITFYYTCWYAAQFWLSKLLEEVVIIRHQRKAPHVASSAYIAPNAAICGDVTIGDHCRIMHGAQIIAEGGAIVIGRECVVMENAVLRSNKRHALSIGNNCLVGPNAHVVGCQIEDEVFIATGAAIFHGAKLGRGSEVRVNGVVHLKSSLPAGTILPIGWVAVGDPASIFSPDRHENIWAIQKPLNFPLTVYGVERGEADMLKITRRVIEALGSHVSDEVLTDGH